MKRELSVYPDPVLAERAKEIPEITPELRQLAEDMAETMYDAPGVGLAAPQVPLPAQAVAVRAYRDEAHVAENRRLYNEKFAAAERVLGADVVAEDVAGVDQVGVEQIVVEAVLDGFPDGAATAVGEHFARPDRHLARLPRAGVGGGRAALLPLQDGRAHSQFLLFCLRPIPSYWPKIPRQRPWIYCWRPGQRALRPF